MLLKPAINRKFKLISAPQNRSCLRTIAMCIVLSVALLTTACILQASDQNAAPPTTYRQVTDEIGRTIRIPQSIHRVVSLAPNLTETVYALGLQDLLVGDTDFCDFPPDAQHKAKVGGATNPSLEVIASLHPDLVLVTKSLNRLETVEALEEIGIPSYTTDPHTVDAILDSAQRIGSLLSASDAGASIASDLRRQLSRLEQRLRSVSPTPVLFIVWTEPLISIGRDTFIADALRHAGAVSVIDSPQNWPQVNLEEVVRLQPEYLIFVGSHSGGAAQTPETISSLPGWRLLHAVRDRHFATISDAINRPAPRLISAVEDLARQLHPEAFAPNPQREKEMPAAPPTALFRTPYVNVCSLSSESACAL